MTYPQLRKLGILCPIFSLPSPSGIGDMGESAYQFIDFLSEINCHIWQILPINAVEETHNSPYQNLSSHAGEYLYISPQYLEKEGLIDTLSSIPIPHFNTEKIDYPAVRAYKQEVLRTAYLTTQNKESIQNEINIFKQTHSWVYAYATFLSLRKKNNYTLWNQWPKEEQNWINNTSIPLNIDTNEINFHIFVQYIFFKQWNQLKNYANQKKIHIMGDIPFYLNMNSLDVWANQSLFSLDENKSPSFVSGCPPDYFSPEGQLWGMPTYNWVNLKKTHYQFWINRLEACQAMFDIVRVDHFRAFDTFWQIPIEKNDAQYGTWEQAPGADCLRHIFDALPDLNLIVEDLGQFVASTIQLRDQFNLTGMHIFQFFFNPRFYQSRYTQRHNIVLYSGTHDNSSLLGWYHTLKIKEKENLHLFFDSQDTNDLLQKILIYLAQSKSKYCIFNLPDILMLDDQARINTPGTVGSHNWSWQLRSMKQLDPHIEFLKNTIRFTLRM